MQCLLYISIWRHKVCRQIPGDTDVHWLLSIWAGKVVEAYKYRLERPERHSSAGSDRGHSEVSMTRQVYIVHLFTSIKVLMSVLMDLFMVLFTI